MNPRKRRMYLKIRDFVFNQKHLNPHQKEQVLRDAFDTYCRTGVFDVKDFNISPAEFETNEPKVPTPSTMHLTPSSTPEADETLDVDPESVTDATETVSEPTVEPALEPSEESPMDAVDVDEFDSQLIEENVEDFGELESLHNTKDKKAKKYNPKVGRQRKKTSNE